MYLERNFLQGNYPAIILTVYRTSTIPSSRCFEQYFPFSPGKEKRGCLEQSGPAHLPPFTFCMPEKPEQSRWTENFGNEVCNLACGILRRKLTTANGAPGIPSTLHSKVDVVDNIFRKAQRGSGESDQLPLDVKLSTVDLSWSPS